MKLLFPESGILSVSRFLPADAVLLQVSLTGISSGTMSDIENGNTLPATPSLIKLSEALDCSIDWILTGKSRSSEITIPSDSNITEWINLYNQLSPEEQKHCLRFIKGYIEIGKNNLGKLLLTQFKYF